MNSVKKQVMNDIRTTVYQYINQHINKHDYERANDMVCVPIWWAIWVCSHIHIRGSLLINEKS